MVEEQSVGDSTPNTAPKSCVNGVYAAHLDRRAHHRNPIYSPISASDWDGLVEHLQRLPDFEVGELVFYKPSVYHERQLCHVVDVVGVHESVAPTGHVYSVVTDETGLLMENLWGLGYDLLKGPEGYWTQEQVLQARGFFTPTTRIRTAKRQLF
jgi:hypothetical protein